MSNQPLLFEKKEHVAVITLNRPDQLNALNYELLNQLDTLIKEIDQSYKEIRVVLVTGEGRAFSAGADLKERLTLNDQQVRRNVKKIRDVFTALEKLRQPTIAAINGYAFGGGFELALACDFRFAISTAQFGLPEVSLGIIPGAGGTQRLSRIVGVSKAKEWILTARKMSAWEGVSSGFLNGLEHTVEDLYEQCFDFAAEITTNAPLAVYQAKYAIHSGYHVDLQSGLDVEANAYEVIIPTRDRKEALEAFKNKRKPVFVGE
ncbi:enoyl-CoA hydratase [Brevibacillus fluminis]|uniref:Enoyl-CoA hydratase n=1 Tax=Brevibacillus fluminis TaxID=511487 RepID=A0A3M8DJM8_9BACL|nr:enoyl-CoA hydratase-related protein [Brevibacillus fluminis]RNB87651.1 enoyl-CoA hydratase [Brevibacillus fluminis]